MLFMGMKVGIMYMMLSNDVSKMYIYICIFLV